MSVNLNFSADAAATMLSNKLLNRLNPSEKQKTHLLPIQKYNLMAHAFNGSTVLAVAAIATAILGASAIALALGSAALLTHLVTQKEMNKVAVPAATSQEFGQYLAGLLSPAQRAEAISAKLGLHLHQSWREDKVSFLDLSLWKNTIELPTLGSVSCEGSSSYS